MNGQQTKLVINADDFGMTLPVSKSIIDGIQRGLTTSASVMINMPPVDESLCLWSKAFSSSDHNSRIKNGPGLGIHFCLTSGPSVLSADKIPLLTDRNGRFKWGFAGLIRCVFSPFRKHFLEQVSLELDAQLDKADKLSFKYGLSFGHIDSHQHIHVMPGICSLIQRRAQERDLVLRRPCEHFGSSARMIHSIRHRFPGGIVKKIILNRLIAFTSWENSVSPEYFGIIDTGHLDDETIPKILAVIPILSKKNRTSFFEINLHPWDASLFNENEAACSAADRSFASSINRTKEFRAILNRDRFMPLLDRYGIKLSTFSEIK